MFEGRFSYRPRHVYCTELCSTIYPCMCRCRVARSCKQSSIHHTEIHHATFHRVVERGKRDVLSIFLLAVVLLLATGTVPALLWQLASCRAV